MGLKKDNNKKKFVATGRNQLSRFRPCSNMSASLCFNLLDEEHLPDPSAVGVLALDRLDGCKLEVRMRMAG